MLTKFKNQYQNKSNLIDVFSCLTRCEINSYVDRMTNLLQNQVGMACNANVAVWRNIYPVAVSGSTPMLMALDAQMGRNGKLRCLNDHICLFTPTFHFMFPSKFTWVTHTVLRHGFVYHSMQSKCRTRIYRLHFIAGVKDAFWVHIRESQTWDDESMTHLNISGDCYQGYNRVSFYQGAVAAAESDTYPAESRFNLGFGDTAAQISCCKCSESK